MSKIELDPPSSARPAEFLQSDSLWRHANFRWLWYSESVSAIGTQITLVALPLLAVYALDASPFEMGLLNAAGQAPSLVFGIFIGVLVDRMRRRRLMIVADVVRAALLSLIPIAWYLDLLTMHMLLVVSFLVGTMTVVFNVAWQAMLPGVVSHRQLTEANSKLHVSLSVAQIAGPGVGALLVGLITAPVTIIVDTVSYLISAIAIWRVDVPDERTEISTRAFHHDIAEGLGLVLRHRLLRPLALSGSLVSFFSGVFFAVYLLFLADDLALGSVAIGIVLASGGVGSLVASGLAPRIVRRIGDGNTVILGHFLFGVTGISIPAAVLFPAVALPMVIASEFFQWGWHIMALVSEITIRQTVTPDRLLGRMASTFNVLKGGAMPIGALTGGIFGEIIGIPATLIVSSAGFIVAFSFVCFSDVRGYWN